MTENIAIITEAGKSINFRDYWGFALRAIPNPGEIHLIACHTTNELNVVICTFKGEDRFTKACKVLSNLYAAIDKGDKVWDVKDHNSNPLRG